jgi:hypothetical protein
LNLLRQGRPPGTITALPHGVQARKRERLVLGMVNEAAACLGEGVVDRAETIDLAMVLGTGWAPSRRTAAVRPGSRTGKRDAGTQRTGTDAGPRFAPSAEFGTWRGRFLVDRFSVWCLVFGVWCFVFSEERLSSPNTKHQTPNTKH